MRNGGMVGAGVLGVCLVCGGGLAPPAAAQAGRIPYEAFTLPNGLRVLYSEDHSTPIVSVDVWYNAGSRNERPGRSGFAHLFEHMMFEGSAHVKKGEHFQLISRAGGSENGSTAEDRTNYYETIPSNRLNLALWLEADRMRSLAITDENFHNQRETVKEERRLRVDNQPYAPAFIDGMTWPFDSATCFAYAHTVIGSIDDLNAAQLSDAQAFFDTYYAPNNATPVVVGDFRRRGPGVLLALAIANQGVDPLKLDTLVSAQLDSLRATGVTGDELTKAKNTFRAGFIRGRETTLGKAEELQHYDMFHASLAEINGDLDRFLAVTADDIRRVAGTYPDPADALVIILKPAAGGPAQ